MEVTDPTVTGIAFSGLNQALVAVGTSTIDWAIGDHTITSITGYAQ
ncbi:MAG: hypothetical protein ACJARI_000875 [Bacteroidia bacterium]